MPPIDLPPLTPPPSIVLRATVTSKGQVTLPIEMRRRLGIESGSQVEFMLSEHSAILAPKLPMSAYRGFLKHLNLPDDFADIPKEVDKY